MKILLHDGREPVLLRYEYPSFELCWKKQTKDKVTGEVTDGWAPQLYFVSPAQALSRLLTMKVGNSDTATLKELKAAIEKASLEIMEAYSTQITEEELKNVKP